MKAKVEILGIRREAGRLYWVAQNSVWSKPMTAGAAVARLERKTKPLEPGYMYFLDKDGDVSSAPLHRVKQ
jgi:hypothetical protein